MKLFSTNSVTKVYVYNEPIHMGRQFDGLRKLVKEKLHKNPASGDLFLFVNRSRQYVKVLFYRNLGFCILAKRLDTSKFELSLKRATISIEEMQTIIDSIVEPRRVGAEAKANAQVYARRNPNEGANRAAAI